MKIVYASTSPIPSRAANSIHSMRMCQAFKENGHDVILLARRGDNNYRFDDIFTFYNINNDFKIIFLPWPSIQGGGVFYWWKTKQLLNNINHNIDLFYGRSIYGVFAALQNNVPSIFEAHALPARKLRKYFETRILKHEKLIRFVVISEALKNDYLALFPWIHDQIDVLVAHDATNAFENKLSKIHPWVGRANCTQIGYTGHLYKGKGIEIIYEIANRLPSIDFHVVGGSTQDIEYWKSRRAPFNIYFHGFVTPGEVNRFLNMFDILLLPNAQKVSVYGGTGDIGKWTSPLKMFEYMASGKPIIASALPVLEEVLKDEINCLLVKPHIIDDWIFAIRRLQDNPFLAHSIGNNAKMDVISKYTWKHRASKTIENIVL